MNKQIEDGEDESVLAFFNFLALISEAATVSIPSPWSVTMCRYPEVVPNRVRTAPSRANLLADLEWRPMRHLLARGQARSCLYDAITIASAGGVSEEERKFAERVAKFLGVDDNVYNAILSLVGSHDSEIQEEHQMF